MITRHFVPTRLLQSGMKIDQSIIDSTDRVLIQRGATLDDYLISALKRLGISGVYIREGEEEIDATLVSSDDDQISEETQKTINRLQVPDRAKVRLNESVRSRVAEGMTFLYNNTEDVNFLNTTRTIADELLKAIDDNDAIAVDINELKICDEYTFKHSVDVATMSMVVAKKLGLSKEEIYDIGVAGLLHDIGKSKVPNEILNKPAKLTDEEFAVMKLHSLYGYQILKKNEGIKEMVRQAVLQHHEKINGNGYPMGVDGFKICPYAKILSIADIYDALVTERPYKAGFSPRDAVEMIMAMTDELDMFALKGFLSSVILYPVGTVVTLSNGERAKVVENIEEAILRPTVVGLKSGRVYRLATDFACANIIIN